MMVLGNGHATMRLADESMAQFAARMVDQLGLPIIDATGLEAKYDFTLHWVVDEGRQSVDTPEPTIFFALQDQLGLRLESKTALVDVMVVDRIEKMPVEN